MQRFTPRREKGGWSDSNKRRVGKLIRNGRMTKAGLGKIEIARINGAWDRVIASTRSFEMPVELEEALELNESAKGFYESLSPSCRKRYIGWIASAKKEETRRRRVKEAMRLLSEKQKLDMK